MPNLAKKLKKLTKLGFDQKSLTSSFGIGIGLFFLFLLVGVFTLSPYAHSVLSFLNIGVAKYNVADVMSSTTASTTGVVEAVPQLDRKVYDTKLLQLALGSTSPLVLEAYRDYLIKINEYYATTTATTTKVIIPASGKNATTTKIVTRPKPPTSPLVAAWPVKKAYPNVGALLPANRIVAYYGNFYSTKMGALGEYEPSDMLARLQKQVKEWESADPYTPVIPALHYIVVTAQSSPGKEGKYRLRMPDSQIDKTLELAKQINAIVFIDIQVGLSTIADELPQYEKYFKMPNVHLGVDPEFYMRNGAKPGTVIGTMDASDVNYVVGYLSKLVKENSLPPKVLVIHRFTHDMVTRVSEIKPTPEVQVVMQMDGWGSKERKLNTYRVTIVKEPVQFTGFKIFYKNDFREKGSSAMTPGEVLRLKPQPSYIQYQ